MAHISVLSFGCAPLFMYISSLKDIFTTTVNLVENWLRPVLNILVSLNENEN